MPGAAARPNRPPTDLVWTLRGQSMGTTWTVKLVPPTGHIPADFQAIVEAELARIVAIFSHWDPTSELSRFNAAPAGTWALSEPLWQVLTASLDLSDDTDGAVDPTLGRLVDLWGFGPPGPRPLDSFGTVPTLPSDADIEQALATSGWQGLRLNRAARAAVQPGGLQLDLSGIAKGHAIDCVSACLTQAGATSHLVEIGGELKGAGIKPDLSPWWAEVERVAGDATPNTVVAMLDLAMATSGDSHRAYSVGGRRYSHTLDGRTGRPVDGRLAAVTVLDPSAMRADALATALTVMGPHDGLDFAAATALTARLLERTSEGMVEHLSPVWSAMADETPA